MSKKKQLPSTIQTDNNGHFKVSGPLRFFSLKNV